MVTELVGVRMCCGGGQRTEREMISHCCCHLAIAVAACLPERAWGRKRDER